MFKRKIIKFLPAFFIVFQVIGLFGQNNDYQNTVKKYIERFQKEAILEMKKNKIPASITLAQGIIESAAGTSKLATEANNHFGIKCHKEWLGKTYIQDDETKNECFRKYDDPVESYHDHSDFLVSRDRYKSLFSLDISDYKGWARGLKDAGYATNPNYPDMLIRTVETYQLQRFDNWKEILAITDSTLLPENITRENQLPGLIHESKSRTGREIYVNNRLKLIIAAPDDNIYQISMEFDISVEKLLKYNDLAFATSLKPGQFVYLESKRRRAAVPVHIFKEGESLYSVSQHYGIKLKMIYKRNKLENILEPPAGTLLKLR